MRKLCFVLFLTGLIGCTDIEEIDGPCTVTLEDKDGNPFFYDMADDIRKNKRSGVFTYRDLNNNLWSISKDTTGNYVSKSFNGANGAPLKVIKIECPDPVGIISLR